MADISHPKIYDVDRNVLSTVLHIPSGKGPFPAVIVLCGFTGHKKEPQIKKIAEELAENGIIALRFDPTGFGESEGSITEDYRISTYMNDIDTMWNYLKHQDNVKKDSIGLWGHSMGGMLAVCFASEYPSEITAVVAVSAPSWMGSGEKIEQWQRDGAQKVETNGYGVVSIPYAFLEDGRPYNALEAAKSLKQPILVVVGSSDSVVDPKDTRSIYDAIPEVSKELLEISGMDHDYGLEPSFMARVNEASVAFFASAFSRA